MHQSRDCCLNGFLSLEGLQKPEGSRKWGWCRRQDSSLEITAWGSVGRREYRRLVSEVVNMFSSRCGLLQTMQASQRTSQTTDEVAQEEGRGWCTAWHLHTGVCLCVHVRLCTLTRACVCVCVWGLVLGSCGKSSKAGNNHAGS